MDAELRQAALTEIDALLALANSGRLDASACARLVALASEAPGRTRRLVNALARQRDAAAVDALLELPSGTSGVVEALFGALRQGVARRDPRVREFPRMLALEFRSSKARRFPSMVERASAAFGPTLERIRVDGKLHYRAVLFEHEPARPSLRERAAAIEFDVEHLHRDLSQLRGVRVWLNGWCFDDASPLTPRSRAVLVRGWFDWARTQTETRATQSL